MALNRISADMVSLNDGTKVSDIAKSPQSYTWTATEGQTLFTLPVGKSYAVGKKVLQVIVGGVPQVNSVTETSTTSFTLSSGVPGGVTVEARWTEAYQPIVAGTSVTQLVDYTEKVEGPIGILSEVVVSVKKYGAKGDGVTDDTTAIQTALSNADHVYFPPGTYLITASLTLKTNNTLQGSGPKSVINTSTANINLISGTSINRAVIRDLKLSHVASTTNGHGIILTGSSDCKVLNCEITGVSGNGVFGTGGTTRLEVQDCYFHSFTGSLQDSSDIAFYNNCTHSKAINNRCHGGNWHGIRFQLDSTDNLAQSNTIGTHTAYGMIITYEPVYKVTRNRAVDNIIYDILGSVLIEGDQRAGAGIYGVSGGDLVISGNIIRDTNQQTITEVLTPAGIGLANMQGSCVVTGNNIISCDWYGIAVFSSTLASVIVANNTVTDAGKTSLYSKNSSHVTFQGNDVWNDSVNATAIQARDQTATSTDISIVGNTVNGDAATGPSTGIHLENINDFVVNGNRVKGTRGRGILIQTCNYGNCSGNTVKDATTEAIALLTCTYVPVNGNSLESNGTYSVLIGTSATKVVLEGNTLVPAVVNNSGGGKIKMTGTAAPSSGTWGVGDTVYNEAPTAGGKIGWICTTSGTPGTWKPFGAIDA